MELYNTKKNYLGYARAFWFLLGFVFFLISALASSIIILLLENNEWELALYLGENIWDFTMHTFPFLLLIPSIIGFTLAILFFKRILFFKSLSLYLTFILIFFTSTVFTLVLLYTGFAKNVHIFAKQFSFYNIVEKNRQNIWQNPDFGLLSGNVGVITDLNDFLLLDNNYKTWNIKSQNPKIDSLQILKTGNFVKLVGRKNDDNSFEAKEIRP